MESITIRRAILSDIKGLIPLMGSLGYPTNENDFVKHFKKFNSKDGNGVAVAIVHDVLTGFVAWSKSLLFVSSVIRIHIEAILVDEKYRGLGIGKKLMEYVEKIAIKHSPAIIDLTSGKRRAKDGTHEFYKKLGYKNEGYMAKLYLRKQL